MNKDGQDKMADLLLQLEVDNETLEKAWKNFQDYFHTIEVKAFHEFVQANMEDIENTDTGTIMPERAARICRMLASPYYKVLIKVIEANNLQMEFEF